MINYLAIQDTDNPVDTIMSQATAGTVFEPSELWKKQAERWLLPFDLMLGTLGMRKAGRRWLPLEPREKVEQYNSKLYRTVLHNGLENAIERVTARPFSKKVSITGTLPERLQPLLTNVDREGTDLTGFARTIFSDALLCGHTHVLVDYPAINPRNAAEELQQGGYPYFTHIPAWAVIGVKYETQPDGSRKLTQVRIFEEAQQDKKSGYTTDTVYQVRVLEPGRWTIYRKSEDGKDNTVKHASGEFRVGGVPLDYIPLHTAYFKKVGFFESKPPFETLAWLNCAHWQSTADHRNYLRFVRIGILLARGFAPQEIQKGLTVAPNSLATSINPDATLAYIEHSGKAYEAGMQDLKHLEERMEIEGTQPLVERNGASTATGKEIDEVATNSQAQTYVQLTKEVLLSAFIEAHKYLGADPDPKLSVDVFNNFALLSRSASDIVTLNAMRERVPPDISRATYLDECRKRGIIGDAVDAEEEDERIATEIRTRLADMQPPVEPPVEPESNNDAA